MLNGIVFHVFCLLIVSVLIIAYFSKKRINTLETKFFIALLFVNFVGILLHIGCYLTITNVDVIPTIITSFVTKAYVLYVMLWFMIFMLYTLSITSFRKIFKSSVIISIIVFIFLTFYIFSNPIYYYNAVDGIYSYGPSIDFLFIMFYFTLVLFIIIVTCNIKYIKNKKFIPLLTIITIGTLTVTLQKIFPTLLLQTALHTLEVVIMWFTIENPDMKMIEQLNIARDQADKANNAKSEFLSSMSHEIRTPLNAIVGFSQALLEENIPESAQEEVNDIMMASDSLLEIVNGILDISKIEANKLEIIDTEYELNKTLKELVSLTKTRIGEKPIEFRSNIDPSIPEVLYGDHTRLKQVILNLLTNAAKYTNEGYIEFKISSVIKNDVCRLIITVEDTGIGIKKEKINNLFTKFDRLEVEKQTTIEGTGLGLAITKKLVELMNGKIVVQSVYGKGSKFTVAIDQKIVANKKIEKQEEVKEASLDLTGKTLLVVDDNKVNLKVAERLLKSYNVTVKTLSSGIDAIDTIKNGEVFDLILMDDMMPKMSGTETMHHLKELEGFNIPVVALTANAISGMKEKYLSEGFDDYLSKPIQKPELNEVLAKYLK